jgi:hypothetical protein
MLVQLNQKDQRSPSKKPTSNGWKGTTPTLGKSISMETESQYIILKKLEYSLVSLNELRRTHTWYSLGRHQHNYK